jgi:hypothetical protein
MVTHWQMEPIPGSNPTQSSLHFTREDLRPAILGQIQLSELSVSPVILGS